MMKPMRRQDRLVSDPAEIADIFNRCDIVHLAMNGEGFPYVVPMNFGSELSDGRIVLYFHCAGEGYKLDLMEQDPKVCVEAEICHRIERTGQTGITTRYESVIGIGTAERLTDRTERIAALKCILQHYKEGSFPVASCEHFNKTILYRVILTEVTGKRNTLA